MKKNIRVIISSSGSPTKIAVIKKILTHFTPSYCTLVYVKHKFPLTHYPNIQWLNFYDLIYGIYPIQWDSCLPIDEPLLRKLSYCETQVLQMMNRLDWDETISYIARKDMYLTHVRFWNNELLTKKIDMCIFFGIPHEMFDFVLYSLCKIHAIPTIILESGRHRDTTFLFHDYEQSMQELSHQYNKLLSQPKKTFGISKKFSRKLTDISFLKMSFIKVYKWRVYETISYIKEVIFIVVKNPKKILFRLLNPLFLLHRIKSVTKKQLLKLYYQHISKYPDLTKKYVFVALHYQPECTTSPLGGVYVNQELMVHMLHHTLPDDVLIYVKEHPLPSYTMRSFSFYKSLTTSPRVVLIRTDANSQELMEHSLAVATVTGTVGWEAIAKQKPILMFGHEYYQFAPGVFQIDSIESCKQALHKIIDQTYTPTPQELNIFYRAMENVSIDGYIDDYYKPQSFLSPSANIEHLSKALIKEIKSIR